MFTSNMRGNRKKTHKLTDFSPKSILLHVVISSVIQLGKSFYPVVLFKNYLICIKKIFMKIIEK